MTDSSESPLAARGSRISPETVAERVFTQTKRGYAESEVRAYLRMVAEDLASVTTRERELQARVRELEQNAHKPVLPASDQDLIAALGEETARVLRQARESATELRGKAEEHARRVVREAQETARELRATTQQAVEAKTREAEDAARARAKEIVSEARAARERVLTDLTERREQLERQINELRGARGQLVETYQLVERALQHATRVMAEEPSSPPEARVPAEPADATPERSVEMAEQAATVVSAATVTTEVQLPPVGDGEPAPEPPAPSAVAPAQETVQEPGHPARDPAPDVGALFEKLRSEKPEAPAPAAPTPLVEGVPPVSAVPDDPTRAPETESDVGPTPRASASDPGATAGAALARDVRDNVLTEITADLLRRGKRALQDEQNDVLDGLRRQRGKIDVSAVLPPLDEQLARWAHVLQPAIDAAYSAGAASADGKIGEAPRALLTELSTTAVAPLRDRLSSSIDSIDAIDSRSPADVEIAVAQRLGARYREWRGQELETVLGDIVAVAHSRGVYDAAADGARLRWIPANEGKCPDCDDNALEPTVKGSKFPTGQPHPPAHPGCRCLLVVDTEE
jgi:DivIVA domain-containing protein